MLYKLTFQRPLEEFILNVGNKSFIIASLLQSWQEIRWDFIKSLCKLLNPLLLQNVHSFITTYSFSLIANIIKECSNDRQTLWSWDFFERFCRDALRGLSLHETKQKALACLYVYRQVSFIEKLKKERWTDCKLKSHDPASSPIRDWAQTKQPPVRQACQNCHAITKR